MYTIRIYDVHPLAVIGFNIPDIPKEKERKCVENLKGFQGKTNV